MSCRGTVVAVVFCMTAGAAVAQAAAPTKRAWEWTPAERAQARRSDELRRGRVEAHRAKLRSGPMGTASSMPAPADVIDGSRNPELFFVTELFEILVRNSFVTMPNTWPHVVRQRTTDLFRDPEEWTRFAAVVTEYADVLRQQNVAAEALDRKRVSEMQAVKCNAGSRALRKARAEFGAPRFNRMLYEVVASGMTTTFSADTDFAVAISKAQEREERCQ